MLRGLMDPHLSAALPIFPFRATPRFSLPWREMMRAHEPHWVEDTSRCLPDQALNSGGSQGLPTIAKSRVFLLDSPRRADEKRLFKTWYFGRYNITRQLRHLSRISCQPTQQTEPHTESCLR